MTDAAADVLDSVRAFRGASVATLADHTGRDPEEVAAALHELQEAGEVYRAVPQWFDRSHAPKPSTDGPVLRRWRQGRGWSQMQTAVAVGLPPVSGQAIVSAFERGLPVSQRVQDALRGLVSR